MRSLSRPRSLTFVRKCGPIRNSAARGAHFLRPVAYMNFTFVISSISLHLICTSYSIDRSTYRQALPELYVIRDPKRGRQFCKLYAVCLLINLVQISRSLQAGSSLLAGKLRRSIKPEHWRKRSGPLTRNSLLYADSTAIRKNAGACSTFNDWRTTSRA